MNRTTQEQERLIRAGTAQEGTGALFSFKNTIEQAEGAHDHARIPNRDEVSEYLFGTMTTHRHEIDTNSAELEMENKRHS